MWKIASILALLIVAVLAGWFYLGQEEVYEEVGGPDRSGVEPTIPPAQPIGPDAGQHPVPQVEPALESPLPQEPEWVLPPLDQSDPFVREQLTLLGLPETWAGQDEIVRRLAVVAENAARGEYPRRQLQFLGSPAPFRVIDQEGRLYVDPANYSRFDPVLDALEAVDPRLLARLLTFLMPLVDQSLGELGASGGTRPLLATGLRRILEVPILTDDIEVLRPNVFYVYADPALEQLRPLQKLILRTGPSNVLRVQAYARRLGGVMGIQAAPVAPY